MIHRDIKPANILFEEHEPVVADFGIALAVGTAGGHRLTETGLSLGTPFYMSPEQAAGDQIIGPATDVYALGCVLFEMLVGEPPHIGSTAQAVLGKILTGGRISTRDRRPSVPANVDAAVRRALEKLPADRFASVEDFVTALQDPAFRYGEDPSLATHKDAGRWRALAVAATTVVVFVTSALLWTRLTFHAAEDARPAWASDGESVMFSSLSRRPDERVGDLYVKPADGTRPAELFLRAEGPGRTIFDITQSPGGDWMVFRVGGTEAGVGERDLVVFRPGVDSVPSLLLGVQAYDEMAPALSPDGRHLAYVSDESGREEVYVRPFPDVESARWTVSVDGGNAPRWAHGGGELFYLTSDGVLVAAAVEADPAFRVRGRERLFQIGPDYRLSRVYALYDPSPDDQRFLFVRQLESQLRGGPEIILVQNWFEELKATVGR